VQVLYACSFLVQISVKPNIQANPQNQIPKFLSEPANISNLFNTVSLTQASAIHAKIRPELQQIKYLSFPMFCYPADEAYDPIFSTSKIIPQRLSITTPLIPFISLGSIKLLRLKLFMQNAT